MKSPAAALGTLLVLTACAHGPTTTTTADASKRASSSAAASSEQHSPSAAAQRAVHRAAARSAPNRPPAPAMPQILGASVSPSVVGSGSTVSATVRTTPGVVSVVAYAGGASMAVPRVGPGLFEGSTTLPPLPPFAHGSYAVTFVARDARGASTQSAVGVTVR